MPRRRTQGNETVHRLADWDRGQAASERLAAHILRADGFKAVDPAHPLGGPDGLKDVLCERDNRSWVGAAYFPRGQQSFSAIRKKFFGDLSGATEAGFVFVTNQRLTKGERSKLLARDREVAIIHLERIAHLLNTPALYGVRLEFLDIEMNRAEQVSFFASRDDLFQRLSQWLERVESLRDASDGSGGFDNAADLRNQIPLDELKEFKAILESISNPCPWTSGVSLTASPRVQDLRVSLYELREFETLLGKLCGYQLGVTSLIAPHVSQLRVPLEDLREYERILDRTILKARQVPPCAG